MGGSATLSCVTVVRWLVAIMTLAGCGRLSFDVLSDGNASDVADVPNRMFLSQLTTDGSFGSVGFADQTCATEAANAGLVGTFIAFVSDSTRSARAKLAGSRGWVRVDGTPIGDMPDAMFDSAVILNPSNQLADGALITNAATWTGSDGKGAASVNCLNWKSASAAQMGDGNSVLNATFAGGNTQTCDVKRRFMCIEIGRNVAVAPRSVSGRLVFTTNGQRNGGQGVAAANTLCTMEATAAGLPGTYHAALATSTATVASRFTEDNRPWVRIDGTQLAAAGQMFTAVPQYDSFPNQQADGTYINVGWWTGVTSTPTAPSTLADTCQDWTNAAAGMSAVRGVVATANHTTLWSNAPLPCNMLSRFICMQD